MGVRVGGYGNQMQGSPAEDRLPPCCEPGLQASSSNQCLAAGAGEAKDVHQSCTLRERAAETAAAADGEQLVKQCAWLYLQLQQQYQHLAGREEAEEQSMLFALALRFSHSGIDRGPATTATLHRELPTAVHV